MARSWSGLPPGMTGVVIGGAAAGDDGGAIVSEAAAGDDGGAARAVVVAASGHHLDAHGWDPGRVGGRVGGVLEVVAGADRPGALGKGQPVALAGLAAEEDLEAAVGVDVERGVVEHPHDLVVHRTPGLAGLHRDRHVGGALRLAGHPVGVVGGDGGVEVDGVGVVAQQLSVRGDDAMEPGGGRVALEQSDQAPLQVVHEGPVRADNIVGGVQIPFRRHPAPVHLAQKVDQLVQRPAGRGVQSAGHSSTAPQAKLAGCFCPWRTKTRTQNGRGTWTGANQPRVWPYRHKTLPEWLIGGSLIVGSSGEIGGCFCPWSTKTRTQNGRGTWTGANQPSLATPKWSM